MSTLTLIEGGGGDGDLPVTPVIPYPTDPYRVAARLKDEGRLDGWTEREGSYYQWTGSAYERRTTKEFRNYLGEILSGLDWNPNKAKLSNVMDAVALNVVVDPDCHLLALKNGLLDTRSDTLIAPTPYLFVTNYLPYAHDPDAECPQWYGFLHSVWPDDSESIALLQEWFGYLVSGSTARQKALLMIGPRRSGKGTIMRVAESLLGQGNTGALKMSNLSSWFGAQTVLGKSLAVIGDLRIDGHLRAPAVETLLSITGEDLVNIQRKGQGLEPVDVRLRCRIMAGTNAPPLFRDAGGALPTRFLYLVFTRSFYGHEDITLTSRLEEELPGMLNWSIQGWRRLERDGWTTPTASDDVTKDAQTAASPIGQFLNECCSEAADDVTVVEDLFAHWTQWAKPRGFTAGDISQFGSEVRGQWPHVQKAQRRMDGRRRYVYVGVGVKG